MIFATVLLSIALVSLDDSPPNAKDWPHDRVEVGLTREEARVMLRALTLNLPVNGPTAKVTIESLNRQLSFFGNRDYAPMPRRFHDESVNDRDDVIVIDAWQLGDRFGRTWIGDNPLVLRAFVELVNIRRYVPEIAPGTETLVYRWIPIKTDDFNWAEWRRCRDEKGVPRIRFGVDFNRSDGDAQIPQGDK